jgi:seryl-tRNA synthetase
MVADIRERAELVCRGLGLQYRVLDLCTGELGNQNARTFDLEVYAPGVDKWLEVSSVSWYRDYQARRANVRYRPKGGGPPVMAHTVNGSVLGWVRTFAAVLETYRRLDGEVDVPEVLVPYVGASRLSK